MSAYYLKYYAEIQNFRGQLTRVEIHQRDAAPDAVLQIGDVCGLDLEIQGAQEEVFFPIIKTQARLSMISSDDKPTAGGIKYGDWGEFYTPDATLYKFIIKTKTNASALLWETRWTGYITPDSWQEGLAYRSAITITARDNIGHLQDFEFSENRPAGIDGYGLISIRALINHAMSLVEMPMTFEVNTDPGDIVADGTSVLDAMVPAQKFDDSNWYQVVEDLLDSIGYCLRFTDQNRFTLAPVRHLPLTGETVQQQPVSLEFYGGDGEVVPAVKKVIEEHDYDYDGEAGLEVNGDYSVGSYNPFTYECYIPITNENIVDRYPIHNAAAPYAKVTNPGGTVWNAGSDFWKPGPVSSIMGALEGEGWDNYIFLAANGIDGQVGDRHDLRTQSFRFHCGTPDVTLRLYFHRAPVTVVHWGSGWDPQPPLDWDGVVPMVEPFFGRAGLSKIRYKVKLEHGSTTLWWGANGWGSVDEVNEQEYDPLLQTTDVEIPLGANADIEDDIYLTLYIVHIEYSITQQTVAPLPTSSTTLTGCYARLSNATVEVNQTNLSKNTVRTFNDEKYNVTIKRTPAVAPLSRQVKIAVPSSYEDALFYYPAGEDFPKQYPYMVNWDTVQGNVTKPLPVLVHQQLLCYRGASLWELSGDCAPLAHGLFRFDKLVKYKQRTYLIQSGTIDFLSGTVSGVLLREFLAYDDIWDDTQQGDWEDDGVYGTIGGGASGGGAGHGGSTGGGGSYRRDFFEEDGNGGIKLKDEYSGLWTNGFLTAGGVGTTGGGGGGGDINVYTPSALDIGTFDRDSEADTFNAFTIQSLHTRILALEQNPGGVSSVAGLTGDVAASDLFTALGLGTAATRAVGAIENAGTGLVTGGDVYSFVNSSVATATATFRGTNTTATTEADFLTWADALTHDLNDYVFWATTDAAGNTVYKRYKYDGASWVFEYNLNNSSFTAAQWAAINSGITSQKITGYDTVAGYFTNGVLGTANIPDLATSKITGLDTALTGLDGRLDVLEARVNWDDIFAIDNDGHVYIKQYTEGGVTKSRGFYTYGFITAGGVGSGSGGGGGLDVDRMWQSLTNSPADPGYENTKIAVAHIPDLAMSQITGLSTALSGKADASALNNYLPLSAGSTKSLTGELFVSKTRTTGNPWANTVTTLVTDMVAGDHAAISVGRARSEYNDGSIQFHYTGAGSSSNVVALGLYEHDFLLSVFGNGKVAIGHGYTEQNYKLAVNGTFNATTIYQNGVALGARAFDNTSYLPLSGGTLVNTSNYFLTLHNTTYGGENYIRFVINNVAKATTGYYRGLAFIANENTYARIGVDDSGTPQYWSGSSSSSAQTLLHAGNYNNYAPSKTGTGASGVWGIDITGTSYYTNSLKDSYGSRRSTGDVLFGDGGLHYFLVTYKMSGDAGRPGEDGFIIQPAWDSNGGWESQLYIANSDDSAEGTGFYTGIRCRNGSASTWGSWHKIYDDSNANKSTVPWSCSTLNANGLITAYSGANVTAPYSTGNSFFKLSTSTYTIGLHVGTGGTNRGIYDWTTGIDKWLIYFDSSNTILNYGNVGIGKSSPSYKLDVSGVIHSTTGIFSDGYVTAGAAYTSSDRRLKDRISRVEPKDAMRVLMALRPCEWVWNHRSTMEGKKGAGIVAQEAEDVLGSWILEKKGDYLTQNYNVFHAYEIGGFQYLYTETDKLKDEVKQLRERMEALESENERLKQRIIA